MDYEDRRAWEDALNEAKVASTPPRETDLGWLYTTIGIAAALIALWALYNWAG